MEKVGSKFAPFLKKKRKKKRADFIPKKWGCCKIVINGKFVINVTLTFTEYKL